MTTTSERPGVGAQAPGSWFFRISWVPASASLIGVGYAVLAHGYGIGTFSAPGPGAVPFLVGVLLAAVGAAVTVNGLRPGPEPDLGATSGSEEDAERSSRFGLLPTLLLAAAVCVIVVWQSRIIGLVPATGLATAILAWVMRVRPIPAFLTGLGFAVVAHLLFQQWLEVPLPRGYF